MSNAPLSIALHVSGLLVAAGVAAGLFTVFSSDATLFPVAFWFALGHAVLLGFPLYLVMRQRQKLRWWHAPLGGFIAGALPIALIALFPAADQASTEHVLTIVNGSRTAAGWLDYLGLVGDAGLLGAAGGLAFGLCVVPTLSRGAASVGSRHASRTWAAAIAPVILASVALLAALSLPSLLEDRSCHNPLRSRSSLRSEANAMLMVDSREWPALVKIVQDFARVHGWSYRGDVRPSPDFLWLQISICDTEGTDFLATHAGSLPGIYLSVSQPQGGDSWRRPFAELYGQLQTRWPGRISLTGERGQKIQPPAWLTAQQEK